MAYYWLNQREGTKGYADVEGEVYHYRNNVPGHRKLSSNDCFVYYRPGAYVIFGAGMIGDIDVKQFNPSQETGSLTEYYANIDAYVKINPPVQVREIKHRISFLKHREGLRGVPQNSIYEISRDDYTTILQAAGMGTFLHNLF
jgi:hypothetical protein